MMIWIISIGTVIIMGVGFYVSRKQPTRIERIAAAGLIVGACAIVWLVSFAPYALSMLDGSDGPSQSQASPGKQSPPQALVMPTIKK